LFENLVERHGETTPGQNATWLDYVKTLADVP
jgi:hypothetical protein